MKYAWIEKNSLRWPVCVQCRVLEVSISGYHQHRARRKKNSHPPSSERDGFAGRDSRGLRRSARGVWMAARVAVPEGKRSSRGQAPDTAGDAAKRPAGARQAAFPRGHHRQQPCSAHRSEPARTQLQRGRAEHRLDRRHDLSSHPQRVALSGRGAGPVSRRIVGWSMGKTSDYQQQTALPA
jgi:hypothetical protein